MPGYQYIPLRSDEIRLLSLKGAESNARLEGALHPALLTDSGIVRIGDVTGEDEDGLPNERSYSALSYVWGIDTARQEVPFHFKQGKRTVSLAIKPNLSQALKRLRQDIPLGESRLFWVDALCINQSNVPERNIQVQKMAQIYNSAKSVSVWLGEEANDSCRAFKFIEALLKLENFDPLTKDPATEAEWRALYTLMNRPWFYRRWIVQEISFARHAVLFCGSDSIDWTSFSAATALFVARHRALKRLFQDSSPGNNDSDFLGDVETLGAKNLVDISMNLFRKNEEGVVLERLLSLEALISSLTLFEAGSPHDTIYAILWLAHDAEPEASESAAMNYDPLVRTDQLRIFDHFYSNAFQPSQSPEIDIEPSQLDTQLQSQVVQFEYTQMTQNMSSPLQSPQNDHFSQFPQSQFDDPGGGMDTFLKPPLPRTRHAHKPFRSVSDMDKVMAETVFEVQPHAINVNYDLDVFLVYKQFLEFAMGRSRSLDIICRPWAPVVSSSSPPMPTWIPQLSSASFGRKSSGRIFKRICADPLVGTPGVGAKNYNASGKTKLYPAKGFIQGRVLIVTGFILDTIDLDYGIAHDGIIPSAWTDLVGWSGPPESVPDSYWRLLVGNRGHKGETYPPAYFSSACSYIYERRDDQGNVDTDNLLIDQKCPSIAAEFLRRVQSVVWGRKAVTTEGRKRSKKLSALVPAEAARGDLLAILYGCSVPVVLRRVKKRKADATEDFEPMIHSPPTLSRDSTRTGPSSFGMSDDLRNLTDAMDVHALPANLDSPHQYQCKNDCIGEKNLF